jgi:hypothetical protein
LGDEVPRGLPHSAYCNNVALPSNLLRLETTGPNLRCHVVITKDTAVNRMARRLQGVGGSRPTLGEEAERLEGDVQGVDPWGVWTQHQYS